MSFFAPTGSAAAQTDSLLNVPTGTQFQTPTSAISSALGGSLSNLSQTIGNTILGNGANASTATYFSSGFAQIAACAVVAIIGFMMVSASIKTPAIITQAVNVAGKVAA